MRQEFGQNTLPLRNMVAKAQCCGTTKEGNIGIMPKRLLVLTMISLASACTAFTPLPLAKGRPSAAPGTIVFMGDSITEAWAKAHPSFFAPNRLDRGISGQTTSQMLARFQSDVIEVRPAVVHILAGTNDIAGNGGATTPAAIEANIRKMADLARSHHIKVVLGTLLPTTQYPWRPEIRPVPQILAVNDWIRSYARQHVFCVADYFSALNDGMGGLSKQDSNDGVHPSAVGYDKMERVALPAIACALDH